MLIDEREYKIKGFRSSKYSICDFRGISLINRLQIHASAVYFSNIKYGQYVAALWKQGKDRSYRESCRGS